MRHDAPPPPAKPETTGTALELRAVSHSYGTRKALDQVSLALPSGTFSVLLGPNGAGKTTLFSLVSALFNCRSGSIRIFGHDLARQPRPALSRLGIVFQARTLDLDLTIGQNLHYHAALHGIGGREAARRIDAVLEIVDLAGRLKEKARALSGGQMRRVEIARALLHDPSLLLLDEATVGLDVRSRAAILADIRTLVATRGIGVLWATHLIDEVGASDHLIVMDQGRLVAEGSVPDVLRRTGTESVGQAFASLTGKPAPRAEGDAG